MFLIRKKHFEGRKTFALKHRNPLRAIDWSWNSPVGWLPDTKSKGTGFDSRSCRGRFFTFLGMSWNVFGSTVGMFSDCFQKVLRIKKVVDKVVEKLFWV